MLNTTQVPNAPTHIGHLLGMKTPFRRIGKRQILLPKTVSDVSIYSWPTRHGLRLASSVRIRNSKIAWQQAVWRHGFCGLTESWRSMAAA
jgi:hypothetical protein